MWRLRWDPRAAKAMKNLAHPIKTRIYGYMEERVICADSPRDFGKGLTADKSGLWRYRVGDYRVLCHLLDEEKTVEILDVGHRSHIYN